MRTSRLFSLAFTCALGCASEREFASRAMEDAFYQVGAPSRTTFPLSSHAIPDSIEVEVVLPGDDRAWLVPNDTVTGWFYSEDAAAVSFGREAVPEAGSVIVVRYLGAGGT